MAPALSANVNITALLKKAGCKTFVNLITDTVVLKVFQSAAAKGLTVFALSDEAFKATGVLDLNGLEAPLPNEAHHSDLRTRCS
ncbi:hypothetical protein L1987_79869 [Smallanthus sonchifolius]|uniref:Uncharacterized protein n=1 Tax=Smallanthus sonchifolius TaxID=185202 RepID=A0ACB8YL55_9ASTR|nr:hypothetical protein L1987_79869 [Smallanthus sonchifolius]